MSSSVGQTGHVSLIAIISVTAKNVVMKRLPPTHGTGVYLNIAAATAAGTSSGSETSHVQLPSLSVTQTAFLTVSPIRPSIGVTVLCVRIAPRDHNVPNSIRPCHRTVHTDCF